MGSRYPRRAGRAGTHRQGRAGATPASRYPASPPTWCSRLPARDGAGWRTPRHRWASRAGTTAGRRRWRRRPPRGCTTTRSRARSAGRAMRPPAPSRAHRRGAGSTAHRPARSGSAPASRCRARSWTDPGWWHRAACGARSATGRTPPGWPGPWRRNQPHPRRTRMDRASSRCRADSSSALPSVVKSGNVPARPSR